MELQALTEVIFEAFATGEIATEDWTYKVFLKVSNEINEQLKAGKIDADDLANLQYTALRAGFYVGMNVLRSMITGQKQSLTVPV